MLDANKLLRFMKESADVPLRFIGLCNWSELRVGCYFDRSWASRPDLTSKSSYLVFVIPERNLEDGSPVQLVVLDCKSCKTPRVSRSSVAVEGQSAAMAADAMEWVKVLLALVANPSLEPDSEEAPKMFGKSPLITDAKALYDAAKSRSSGMGINEKRTAIEVLMVNERLTAMGGEWR